MPCRAFGWVPWALWTTSLTLLLAALAPAITHALQSVRGTTWVEVCTLQGSRWVRADTTPAGGAAAGQEAGHQHCDYCLLHAGKPALPVTGWPSWPVADAAWRGTDAATTAVPRALPWHPWQPRAPPTLA